MVMHTSGLFAAAHVWTPSKTSGAWISSTITRAPWRRASAQISSRRSASNVQPPGLYGLVKISEPAPRAKAASSSSKSSPGTAATLMRSRPAVSATSKNGW